MNPRILSAWIGIAAVVAMASAPSEARSSSRHRLLEPTTMGDWRAARMDGTGCYWSARMGGPVLFAAAGRKAVIRLAGRVVVLAPASGASEMFPFTYDVWAFRDLRIRVIDGAVVRAMGDESVTTDATVIVTKGRTATRMRGSMICGS